jgi:hypothetical protein
MGILNFFGRPPSVNMLRLPAGSFTVDPRGRVLASTLPQNFPLELIHRISELVLSRFQTARALEMPFNELVADYSALKLTARELRGGAIIFISPRGLGGK